MDTAVRVSRAISRRHYARDTYLDSINPFGLFVGGRAICADGIVRNLKRIAPTADTFFSTPAAVTIAGKTVSGFVTVESEQGWTTETDTDRATVKFVAYSYGKNHDYLPEGAWRAPRTL